MNSQERERYRQIYEEKVSMSGGLTVGAGRRKKYSGGGDIRSCVEKTSALDKNGRQKLTKKGVPKMVCRKYEKNKKKSSLAAHDSGECNPWILFMKDYRDSTPYKVNLKDPAQAEAAVSVYRANEKKYQNLSNKCRARVGLHQIAY